MDKQSAKRLIKTSIQVNEMDEFREQHYQCITE